MAAARPTASRKTSEAVIDVRPLNGFIGAEIEGVDLARPLSRDEFRIIHDSLVNYEVIVMRDQDITADGIRRPVRRAFDPSLLTQPRRQTRLLPGTPHHG